MREAFFEFMASTPISNSVAMRWTTKNLTLTERQGAYSAVVTLTRYSHLQLMLRVKRLEPSSRSLAFDRLYAQRSEIGEEADGTLVVVTPAPLSVRVTSRAPLRKHRRGRKNGAPYANFQEGRSWLLRAHAVVSASVAAALDVPEDAEGRVEDLLAEAIRLHRSSATRPAVPSARQLVPSTGGPSATAGPQPSPSLPASPPVPSRAADPEGTPFPPCPVCALPVRAAGRTRHQRCESRSSAQIPSATDTVKSTEEATAEYRRLVAHVEEREPSTHGQRRESTSHLPVRLPAARQAVLLRCAGQCENPACGGQPADVTDNGHPILEVDHIQRIAAGGRDHPRQMIALCPNCHAMKERGRNRATLQATLARTAQSLHDRWTQTPSTVFSHSARGGAIPPECA
ncbi:HNH endonuclease signature motif containing protein [Streptomyces sp. KLMMK]|uniref:HNH endonuclease signature motif containing protein n=1 Tax=Streptomyces sp. KLMMK TaxID=3109353 RepID=UPI002FFF3279